MSDIQLTVAVDADASYGEMSSGINSIMSKINASPPKIKVQFDDTSLESMRKQIEILQKVSSSTTTHAAPSGAGTFTDVIKQETKALRANTKAMQENAAAAKAVGADTAAKERNAAATKKMADASKTVAKGDKLMATGSLENAKALEKVNKLLGQVQLNTKKWSAASHGKSKEDYLLYRSQATELVNLADKLRAGAISSNEFDKSFSKIKDTLNTSSTAIRLAGENTQSFGERVSGIAKKLVSLIGVQRAIMFTTKTVKQMVTSYMEIEDRLTQLKIVTGASDTQMEAFFTKTTGLAKELGKSITDVSASIETFSRLGYNIGDASELAKYANILSNVADTDVDTATTGLTSIIKGYGLQPGDAAHVSDVLVKVGQEYAISAEELMAAFQRGGAALAASGTDFEKSAALFAATNASLQNAESVGKHNCPAV